MKEIDRQFAEMERMMLLLFEVAKTARQLRAYKAMVAAVENFKDVTKGEDFK